MTLPLGNVLQPLISVFEQVLLFFHDHVGLGWGLAIIAMTILVRACLIPLTLKQFRSMQELSRHQPEIKKLQEKYKDDKQRLNQEMMGFYKEHKINPLASCLPLAAQMPVFISLFYMLRHDLRFDICPEVQAHLPSGTTKACGPGGDAGFLFIHDLTDKATGGVLIALIVLYVGTQLASSLLMSVSQDKMQRNLMLFLPLIFVTFVISFPAGLILYWITTNLWTMVQQYIVRKRVGPIRPMTAPAGGTGGFLDRLRAGPAGPAAPTPALADGAARGDGAAPNASANGRTAGVKPPPPPRQRKKKRSGRRR